MRVIKSTASIATKVPISRCPDALTHYRGLSPARAIHFMPLERAGVLADCQVKKC